MKQRVWFCRPLYMPCSQFVNSLRLHSSVCLEISSFILTVDSAYIMEHTQKVPQENSQGQREKRAANSGELHVSMTPLYPITFLLFHFSLSQAFSSALLFCTQSNGKIFGRIFLLSIEATSILLKKYFLSFEIVTLWASPQPMYGYLKRVCWIDSAPFQLT